MTNFRLSVHMWSWNLRTAKVNSLLCSPVLYEGFKYSFLLQAMFLLLYPPNYTWSVSPHSPSIKAATSFLSALHCLSVASVLLHPRVCLCLNKPLFEVVVSFSLKHVMIISLGNIKPVESAPISSISSGCALLKHTHLCLHCSLIMFF